MTTQANTPLRGIGFGAVAFGFFSLHDVGIKALGAHYSVFQILFFSALFAFLPMSIAVMADREVGNFRPHHPWLLGLRTFAQVTGMSGVYYAFTVLPLAEVYAIIFAAPLIITVLSVPVLGETVRFQRWVAVVVGLVGVLVVLRPGTSAITLGHICAMYGSLTIATSAVIVRRIGKDERSAVLILIPMVSIICFTGALLPGRYVPVELSHLWFMALVGFLAVAAQLGIISAFRAANAAVVAPLQYTQIIWAVVFGTLFFNETPDVWVVVGTTIVIASGVFVVFRETRPSVSDNTPVLRTGNQRSDAMPSPRPGHLLGEE
ncbi:MAG: DMT family transporter [Rhodobacteraceae bacterium]|nr:DMT family transporter [Paracoccaceae bacterium]